MSIYNLIQEGDALNPAQPADALQRYSQASAGLARLRESFPSWNPKIVDYRLDYLRTRIEALSQQAATNRPSTTTNVVSSGSPGEDMEIIQRLQREIGRLTQQNKLVEAKLKEALSVQPAAVDPRELARTEERVRNLQKERDLLQSTLEQERAKVARMTAASKAGVDRQQLAETQLSLNQQSAALDTLRQEKQQLQTALEQERARAAQKVDPAVLAAESKRRLELEREWAQQSALNVAAQSQMEDLRRQLTESRAELSRERSAVRPANPQLATAEQRLSEQSAALATLQTNNVGLQRQLDLARAELSSRPARDDHRATGEQQLSETQRRISEQNVTLSSLRRDNEDLRRQLEEARKAATHGEVAEIARAASLRNEKELEKKLAQAESEKKALLAERENLGKKLAAANHDSGRRSGQIGRLATNELRHRLEITSARLDAYETRPIPYTPEEVALMKQAELRAAEPIATGPSAERKKIHDLPSGTGALNNEAERALEAGRLADAEEKYLQILRQDENNVYTLSHLAAVQMDLNKLDEAEKTLQRALAADPEDSASLYLMGSLNFRQEKFDAALDHLSLSARLAPDKPQTQFYLAKTLMQKGQRAPAEAALRKAIQLKPGWGEVHYLLAVIYATQKPPYKELSQWHYQKSLAGGSPRNPEFEQHLGKGSPASPP